MHAHGACMFDGQTKYILRLMVRYIRIIDHRDYAHTCGCSRYLPVCERVCGMHLSFVCVHMQMVHACLMPRQNKN